MYKLDWSKLLCEERKRNSEAMSLPHRNGFDMDYDRVISSSSLRRLQDKAQVFPLQENDFTRTRLTHSLEVSSIGRSLGLNIGDWLIKKDEFRGYEQSRKLSSLLAVSCLVHDLGNPPFGHYGEDVIRQWFIKWFNGDKFNEVRDNYKQKYGTEIISEQEKNDFIFFEGNAQTIRILTKLQFLNDQYGINFTYGTLSTLIKYPYSSLDAKEHEKIGYFKSEEDIFNIIRAETGLEKGIRHPATFLLEAADDMSYLLADIEDGVKKGAIPWEVVYNNIKKEIGYNYNEVFKKLEDKRKIAAENDVPEQELINVQNFKVAMQSQMFLATINTFKENYEDIMNGEFTGELLRRSKAQDICNVLKKVAAEYCYANEEVLILELVGNSVMDNLLDLLVNAMVEDDGQFKSKNKTGKIFNVISSNFKYVHKLDKTGLPKKKYTEMTLYDKLMLVTDFISGMTDSYAVNLHKKLTGIKLP